MNAFARAARRKAMLGFYEHQIEFSPDRTLVIIDMQKSFINEDELEIIPNIILLIEHAMAKGWAIIIVEFKCIYSLYGEGNTDKALTEILGKYPHQETLTKYGCDGSKEILRCIESQSAWSLNLLVCGIYGDECVPETVAGLFDRSDLVEVDVVTDAICPEYMSSSEPDDYDQQKEGKVTTQGLGIQCCLTQETRNGN